MAAITDYIKRVSKFGQLSQAEIDELALTVRAYYGLFDGKENKKLSVEQIKEKNNVSDQDLTRLKKKADDAKHKILLHNLKLVVHFSKRYNERGLDEEDLIQEGSIGLARGIEKYKPELGYRFSTYAYWWIMQAMTKALNSQTRNIRLPHNMCCLVDKVKKAQEKFRKQYSRNPTISELAELTKSTEDKIVSSILLIKKNIPLDELDRKLEEVTGDDTIDMTFSDECPLVLNSEIITPDIITELDPLHQFILIRKFGLDGEQPATYYSLAQQLKVSKLEVAKEKMAAFNTIKKLFLID